jgi:adenylate cyclase
LTQEFPIERKLTAVLSADVEGFSRLIEADEVGTLQNLASQRRVLDDLIARYRGRVVNTAGDSVLAEFPSVADAVQCAVDTQKAHVEAAERLPDAKRVLFRIGIHLGDVAVRGNDLLGNGVNIAARLQAMAPAGGIVISGTAHEQVRRILPFTYSDLGAQSVKNIEEPVRAYAVQLSEGSSPLAVVTMPTEGKPLPLPDKPSIAVLPFQNMSGDPEQEYFADGMVEDIITALSRFKSLFVIARNSSFTYKGKAVDIKQVGRELGVRYVLEGSVRKAGGRVRITGQLIEAATGTHLWADKFDGTLEDIFELQDRITSSVVGVIAPQILKTEVEKTVRQPTKDLQAYDFYLRGIASTDNWTPAGSEVTLQMFARAIELDPDFAAAYARLALSYQNRQAQGWMSDPASEGAEAVRLARRAIEIAKDDAYVQAASGFILAMFLGELDRGVVLVDRALGLNANDADAWRWSGWLRMYRGDEELAIEHFMKAQRLNPLDPYIFATFAGLACALFFIDRREEARVWAERALAANGDYLVSLRIMSAIQASLGEIDEARKITRRMQELSPMSRMANLPIIRMLRQPDQKEKLVQALRLAGVPE